MANPTGTSAPAEKTTNFAKLNRLNYAVWKPRMKARLMMRGFWRYITKEKAEPTHFETTTSGTPPTTTVSTTPTDDWITWREYMDQAAGDILLCVDEDQEIHLTGLEEDPIAMWAKLEAVHATKDAGGRFNAFDTLLTIRKHADKSLTEMGARVAHAMVQLKALRPDKFTLDDADKELVVMAMINALPRENIKPSFPPYSSYAPSTATTSSRRSEKKTPNASAKAKCPLLHHHHLHSILRRLPPLATSAQFPVIPWRSASNSKLHASRPSRMSPIALLVATGIAIRIGQDQQLMGRLLPPLRHVSSQPCRLELQLIPSGTQIAGPLLI